MDPGYFGFGGWVWRPRFWFPRGRWWFSVAFGLRCGSAVSIFAAALIFFGLFGPTGDASVQNSCGGLRTAGGAIAGLAALKRLRLVALRFGGAGVLQGGVLSRVLFIISRGLLCRRSRTALVLALIYRIFMGHTVDRPLLSALEGGEGLLGRP